MQQLWHNYAQNTKKRSREPFEFQKNSLQSHFLLLILFEEWKKFNKNKKEKENKENGNFLVLIELNLKYSLKIKKRVLGIFTLGCRP